VALFARDDRTGIELVAKMVASSSSADRMAAIRALTVKGYDEDLPIFAKVAEDDDAEVCGAAVAGALARCGEKAIPLANVFLANKDDKVRADLCSALIIAK